MSSGTGRAGMNSSPAWVVYGDRYVKMTVCSGTVGVFPVLGAGTHAMLLRFCWSQDHPIWLQPFDAFGFVPSKSVGRHTRK